jgi:hypothetical protein
MRCLSLGNKTSLQVKGYVYIGINPPTMGQNGGSRVELILQNKALFL